MIERAEVEQVSPQALRERLDRGEPLVVLDVREPHERDFCVIALPETAADLHIPMGELQTGLEQIQAAALAGPVVVYCHLGTRSMVVARWLAARGISRVQNLDGGIDAWSIAVDPHVARY